MTLREAIKLGGTSAFLAKTDINAAESFVLENEEIRYALVANCIVNKDWTPGVVVLTNHRVFFCHANQVLAKAVQIPLTGFLQVGQVSGGMLKRVTISSPAITLTVEGSLSPLAHLQQAVLTAIEEAPAQSPVDLPADVVLEKYTLET